jgi:hypothetical protein
MKRFFDDAGFEYSPNEVEFDKESWDEYIQATQEIKLAWREKYGKSNFHIWILRRIVKWVSAFVPNRMRRTAFRIWLEKAFRI